MHLSNIKLWNFRKYGCETDLNLLEPDYLDTPHLDLNFTNGLNVIIGANDSGKTAILDAIKLVLKTNSYEWIRIQNEDFYDTSTKFRIELTFDDLESNFSRFFIEQLTIEGEDAKESLSVILEVNRNNDRIFPSDIKAGKNGELGPLTAEQRELLAVTYLKPLRDVKSEFIPKRNSRLSSILEGHKAFKGKGKSHELYKLFSDFHNEVEKYFTDISTTEPPDKRGTEIKEEVDKYIGDFLTKGDESVFSAPPGELKNILEKLELTLKENINPGLGSLNRLFIASELLHLQKDGYDGLQLGLIEEIEAHIHPQAQMKIVESLQSKIEEKGIQLILTTHSPNLVSKVKLQNLIICENNWAFPMGEGYTGLLSQDYCFLERFLDVTKANMFFSKGVIFVEGWAEEIILPTLAKILKNVGIIQQDLTEAEVSVVNVASDVFLRYAKIFERDKEPYLQRNISIVTDIDLKPKEYQNDAKILKKVEGKDEDEKKTIYKKHNIISEYNEDEQSAEKTKKEINSQNIKTYITDNDKWTLEYSLLLFPKFRELFFEAIKITVKQMREDERTSYLRALVDDDFSGITGTNEEVAFHIYHGIMLDKSASKTIVAQNFISLLEEKIKSEPNYFEKSDFEGDSSISYLINAIKYAIGE